MGTRGLNLLAGLVLSSALLPGLVDTASAATSYCECLMRKTCLPPAHAVILCDSREGIRYFTRESMQSRDARTDELLLQLREGNAALRTNAVTDLGLLAPLRGDAVSAVIYALKNDESKWVRRAAARTLGRLQLRNSASALRVALNDGDKWVSHSAAEALKRISSE